MWFHSILAMNHSRQGLFFLEKTGMWAWGRVGCAVRNCLQVPCCCCCCWVASVVSDSVRPHRRQPTRLLRPWDSPGKNAGVGCHVLLQCMKVKSESKVTQSCPTLSNPMDCSLSASSTHGIFQARILEWVAIAFSGLRAYQRIKPYLIHCFDPFTILSHSCNNLNWNVWMSEWVNQ